MFGCEKLPGNKLWRSILLCSIWITVLGVMPHFAPMQAFAASGQTGSASTFPVEKTVSLKSLEKYPQASVTLDVKGKKTKYTGVPLRVIFAEMVPDIKIDSMPEWKELSRKELVVELMGDDGFPGLVTATELAMNKAGDRFILATQENGKPSDVGVHLICKMDEAHVRSIRQIVSIRIVQIAKK